MKMEQSVPKRRHIKFRRWGITQKKKHTTYRTRQKCEIGNYFAKCNGSSSQAAWKIQLTILNQE